jgi:hypothetical protein
MAWSHSICTWWRGYRRMATSAREGEGGRAAYLAASRMIVFVSLCHSSATPQTDSHFLSSSAHA